MSDSNDGICLICCEQSPYRVLGKCNHPICITCCAKLRDLCEQKYCAVCREDLDKVIGVFQNSLGTFEELEPRCRLSSFRGGYKFEDNEIHNAFKELFSMRCSICKKDCKTESALEAHLKQVHMHFFCKICKDNLKIFVKDLAVYSKDDLEIHKVKGDNTDKSMKGHPLCEFCLERYLDNEMLHIHLRKKHFWCHFCEGQAYYCTYKDLRLHFKKDHYLCERGECAHEQITNVFRSGIDLQAHITSRHMNELGKAQQKQMRHIQPSFSFASRSRQRGGGGGSNYPSSSNSLEGMTSDIGNWGELSSRASSTTSSRGTRNKVKQSSKNSEQNSPKTTKSHDPPKTTKSHDPPKTTKSRDPPKTTKSRDPPKTTKSRDQEVTYRRDIGSLLPSPEVGNPPAQPGPAYRADDSEVRSCKGKNEKPHEPYPTLGKPAPSVPNGSWPKGATTLRQGRKQQKIEQSDDRDFQWLDAQSSLHRDRSRSAERRVKHQKKKEKRKKGQEEKEKDEERSDDVPTVENTTPPPPPPPNCCIPNSPAWHDDVKEETVSSLLRQSDLTRDQEKQETLNKELTEIAQQSRSNGLHVELSQLGKQLLNTSLQKESPPPSIQNIFDQTGPNNKTEEKEAVLRSKIRISDESSEYPPLQPFYKVVSKRKLVSGHSQNIDLHDERSFPSLGASTSGSNSFAATNPVVDFGSPALDLATITLSHQPPPDLKTIFKCDRATPEIQNHQNSNTPPGIQNHQNSNTSPGIQNHRNSNTPPGIQNHRNSNTPPGIQNTYNFSAVMNISSQPPPGFRDGQLQPPTVMAYEDPILAPHHIPTPQFQYQPVEDNDARNKKLWQKISNNLGPKLFDQFRVAIAAFRKSDIDACSFIRICRKFMDMKQFDGTIEELVVLLPDISLQRELYKALGNPPTLLMCHVCQQVVKRSGIHHHSIHHSDMQTKYMIT